MKNWFFAILMVLSLGTSPLYATEAEKMGSVSQADAAAVQKGVQELGQMFGVEAPKAKEEIKKDEATTTEKTIAQVMDKAIDKVSDVVGAMAQAIDKIAPKVWEIMLRQQYAKAIMACVVPVGLLVVISIYMGLVGKYWNPTEPNNDSTEDEKVNYYWRMGLVRVGPIIVMCLASLWFFNRLADSVALLINPEFYAIQDLLRMILNKGM